MDGLDRTRAALIADDDEFFRMALRTILRDRLNLPAVIETESFDEAIERLSARDDIALALFDLAMPGMVSPAGLKTVRECFPDVRVAVVSASQARRDILCALEAGVHGYVPKGLGVAELARALEAVCSGMIYVPPSLAELMPGEELAPVPVLSAVDRELDDLDLLSNRQREVLRLLVEGQSNKEMARSLGLSPGTVKFHLAALFRHLGVVNRVEAAAAGARLLVREAG
jgi:DNA-binding NarL/FixJ family response regulator